jgi:hypothetical protein
LFAAFFRYRGTARKLQQFPGALEAGGSGAKCRNQAAVQYRGCGRQSLIALSSRDLLVFCDWSSAVGRIELLEVIARLDGKADHLLVRDRYVIDRDGLF